MKKIYHSPAMSVLGPTPVAHNVSIYSSWQVHSSHNWSM